MRASLLIAKLAVVASIRVTEECAKPIESDFDAYTRFVRQDIAVAFEHEDYDKLDQCFVNP